MIGFVCGGWGLLPGSSRLSPSRHRRGGSRVAGAGRCWATAAKEDVVIVGAGIAGLSAAKVLAEKRPDLSCRVLEKSDDVGGRIRSDVVDGFVLDHGFQVFIEAYPEQNKILDYDALDLQRFLPGALVYCDKGLHLVSDPIRRIADTPASVLSPVGTFVDKVKVGLLRTKIATTPIDQIMSRKEVTTLEYLKSEGFTSSMIDRFFRPFYGGIFLAPLEEQSSRMFEFLFRMFLSAPASLPATGMGAITQQIAEPSKDRIHLNTAVNSIQFDGSGGGVVTTEDGEIQASAIIVAADPASAKKLLSDKIDYAKPRGSTCLYFSSQLPPPNTKPILFLNGEGQGAGIVNNMCFPSMVAPSYAPAGQTLVSVTIVGEDAGKPNEVLEPLVRKQMSDWWGSDFVSQWQFLKSYYIPFSQPSQIVPFTDSQTSTIDRGIFVCGDHRSTPTVNGAIASGVQAAEAALELFR